MSAATATVYQWRMTSFAFSARGSTRCVCTTTAVLSKKHATTPPWLLSSLVARAIVCTRAQRVALKRARCGIIFIFVPAEHLPDHHFHESSREHKRQGSTTQQTVCCMPASIVIQSPHSVGRVSPLFLPEESREFDDESTKKNNGRMMNRINFWRTSREATAYSRAIPVRRGLNQVGCL